MVFVKVNFHFYFVLQISQRLQSFIRHALIRDPVQRATAFELLNHAFIHGANGSTSLPDLMKTYRHSVC